MDVKGLFGGSKKKEENANAKKATDLLEEDHDKVKGLFREYRDAKERGDARTKSRLFQDIDRELSIHSLVEEELFYPAVKRTDKEAMELVLESKEEHGVVKTLLSQLRDVGGGDETFDAKMKVLMEAVEHHIEEEEDEMFPDAESMGGDRLVRLGAEIEARKEQLMGMPVASLGSAPSRAAAESARDSRSSRKAARAPARKRKPAPRAAKRAQTSGAARHPSRTR
jgi:hemerythrin superfamily protein